METTRAGFAALVRFEIELWNAVEQRLRHVDGAVTLGRHSILELASASPNLRIQDIADSVGITVGAASRLTDRIEADGLLTRERHPTDRRSSHIVLTAAGRAALDVTSPAIDAALADILGASGQEGLVEIAAVIERIGLAETAPAELTVAEPEVAR
jgi:DNA-binding MarR family transcriptional regulator